MTLDKKALEAAARAIAGIAFDESHEGDAEAEWPRVAHVAEAGVRAYLAALPSPDPARVGVPMGETLHPSHVTRISMDASSYDEICVNCGATDHIGGWGALTKPCPKAPPATVALEPVGWRWRWNDMLDEPWCLSDRDPRDGANETVLARLVDVHPLYATTPPAKPGVQVAELVWGRDHVRGNWHGNVVPDTGPSYTVKDNGVWSRGLGVWVHDQAGDVEAAKAACQADYRARILSAIQTSPEAGL